MAVGRWRAAIAVLGLLAAGTASAETVLRRPTAAEPETLDPLKTTSSDDVAIDRDLFQPLHRASYEQWGDSWTRPGHLVGNGPYRLESWVPNSELVRPWSQRSGDAKLAP